MWCPSFLIRYTAERSEGVGVVVVTEWRWWFFATRVTEVTAPDLNDRLTSSWSPRDDWSWRFCNGGDLVYQMSWKLDRFLSRWNRKRLNQPVLLAEQEERARRAARVEQSWKPVERPAKPAELPKAKVVKE